MCSLLPSFPYCPQHQTLVITFLLSVVETVSDFSFSLCFLDMQVREALHTLYPFMNTLVQMIITKPLKSPRDFEKSVFKVATLTYLSRILYVVCMTSFRDCSTKVFRTIL